MLRDSRIRRSNSSNCSARAIPAARVSLLIGKLCAFAASSRIPSRRVCRRSDDTNFLFSFATVAILGMLCFHRAKSVFVVLPKKNFEISRRNYARFGKQSILFELEGKRMCTNGFCLFLEHCFPFLPLMGDTLSDIPHIELRQFGNVRVVGLVHVHGTHVLTHGGYGEGTHRDPSLRDSPLQKFESGQVDQSLPSWCSTSIHRPYATHNLDLPGIFCAYRTRAGDLSRKYVMPS